MTIDLDAIEVRARAVPFDVIPHGPQPGGGLLLCFTDANDTDVGRLYGPHQVEIANLLAHARQDIPALVAEVRRLRAELAAAIPTATPYQGGTAEVGDLRVRITFATGGTQMERMTFGFYRALCRQVHDREELRDRGGETE